MIAICVRALVVATAFLAGAAVSVYCAFKLADRILP